MTREAELTALIAEQARDLRFGHRVHSVSLDAVETSHATDHDGERLLRPRSAHRRHHRMLVGHRTREKERRKRYMGRCESCCEPTDGSNGLAKAPKLCRSCFDEQNAAEHGTLSKYCGGCRCYDCKRANLDHSWSNRNSRCAPNHGTVSGYRNYGCRCEPCKRAGSDQNRRDYLARKEVAA